MTALLVYCSTHHESGRTAACSLSRAARSAWRRYKREHVAADKLVIVAQHKNDPKHIAACGEKSDSEAVYKALGIAVGQAKRKETMAAKRRGREWMGKAKP